ncbi:MAG: hypothetical protein JWN37_942 [Candidatus Nomurabacteria bacterium]|nr:hypothetical protein [Candidatus Nomurabacteria bacterium]
MKQFGEQPGTQEPDIHEKDTRRPLTAQKMKGVAREVFPQGADTPMETVKENLSTAMKKLSLNPSDRLDRNRFKHGLLAGFTYVFGQDTNDLFLSIYNWQPESEQDY